MRLTILLITLVLFSSKALALKGTFTNGMVRIEPVVGYEREQKFTPTPHTKDRTFYGGRIMIGPPFFSLEGEYIEGEDTETFPDDNLKIKTESQKYKAGLRSGLRLGPFLTWYFRGGYQGSQRKITEINTTTDVSTSRRTSFKADPYAGTGLRIHLLGAFSLAGDFTVIFTDEPESGDREYQSSLGFNLSI